MAETLILDPRNVALRRSEWDITQYVAEAGPDWGDAAIEQALADTDAGSLPISMRVPSRTVTIPLLLLKSRAGTDYTFDQVRQRFQQKAALFQQEGGWIARTTSVGVVYADVTGATLKFGGSTAQALWGIDADAVLTLTCLPDWYTDEVSSVVVTSQANRPNMLVLGGNYDATALDFPAAELLWTLDAGGSGLADLTGKGRVGSAQGGMVVGGVADAPWANAASTDFDGSDDLVTSAYSPFTNGSKLTIAGWAKRDAAGAVNTLFSSANVAAGTWVRLWIDATNNVYITVNGGTNTIKVSTGTGAWPGTGVWVHWAWTWDSTRNRGYFYINGVVQADAIMTANSYNASPGALVIGGHAPGTDIFDGKIRSVSVHSRVFTRTEVHSLYQIGIGGGVPVAGNYPARVRAIVTENGGKAQNGLLYSIRGRNYSPDGSAAPYYEVGSLTALDLATNDGLAIQHSSLGSTWTPVASTDLIGADLAATGPMTHIGNYRVWALASGVATGSDSVPVQVRLVWDVGDIISPVENPPQRFPNSTDDFLVNLGIVRLARTAVGSHRWRGIIQGIAGSATNKGIYVERIYFQNIDEYAGILTAVPNFEQVTGASVRDEFTRANGNLSATAADVGGAWTTSGETTDFAISSNQVVRSVATDVAGGRLALQPPVLGATSTQVDFKVSAISGSTGGYGIVARRTGANGVSAIIAPYANQITLTSFDGTSPVTAYASFNFLPNVFYTLQLTVGTTGRATIWCWATGGAKGEPVASIFASALATGGTLATGQVGLIDIGTVAVTRTYDNFLAWIAESDAVLYPNRKAELRTDGMHRESVDGNYFGLVGKLVGDLPRLPVSGLEQRPIEVTTVNGFGDFDKLAHRPGFSTPPSTKLQLIYRPCYLFVP